MVARGVRTFFPGALSFALSFVFSLSSLSFLSFPSLLLLFLVAWGAGERGVLPWQKGGAGFCGGALGGDRIRPYETYKTSGRHDPTGSACGRINKSITHHLFLGVPASPPGKSPPWRATLFRGLA